MASTTNMAASGNNISGATLSAQTAPLLALKGTSLSRTQAEDLLFHEARLLDELQLDAWLEMFTEDGLYWTPINEHAPISSNASLVYDTPLRREERVYHLLHNKFPAQSPRSRTVHMVSNVSVEPDQNDFIVRSNQTIYETRAGDFKQIGLGDVRVIVTSMEHLFRIVDGNIKIARKKILLINRDSWLGNMTFIL